MGGFNFPINKSAKGKEYFVKLMNDIGFTQLIKVDTRVTQKSWNLIDMIFTNSPHRVTESGVLKLSMSDHYMVFCSRSCKLPRTKPKFLNVRSFKNFNSTSFIASLQNLPWDRIYLFESTEDAWFAMEELLKDVGNKHAPSRNARTRFTTSMDVRQAIKNRDTMKRKASKAFLGSLALALSMMLGPLAARLINCFGPRLVGLAGGVIGALGLACSPFAMSFYIMYVTFGLLYGMGVCFCYTACYDIVPKYFKKRLGLAMGVLASGSGASAVVMSRIIETLIADVGWKRAFYALAGFVFLAGVCCLSFSPDVEQGEDDTTQQQASVIVLEQTKSLHKNGGFIVLCVFSFVFQLGNTIPLIHLGRYALESGLNYRQTAYLYIGFSVVSMFGRIVSGKICEYRSFHSSYICCSCAGVVGGMSTIVCPFVSGFPALTIYFSINGLADGFHVSSKNVLLMELCETNQRTKAYGYLFFVTSLAYSAGPPLGGWMADQVGSYIPVFYTSGSIVLISGVLVLTVQCFRRKHQETTRTEVKVLLEDYVVEEKVTVL